MKAAVVLPKRLIPDPLWLVSFRNINMNLPSHSGLYSYVNVCVCVRVYVCVCVLCVCICAVCLYFTHSLHNT